MLCILDHEFAQLKIFKSVTQILNSRQGLPEIAEMVLQDKLRVDNMRLVYFLAGRADAHLSSSAFTRSLEAILANFRWKNPRLMCLLCSVLITPNDTDDIKSGIADINRRLARIAEKDPHWLYCNINAAVSQKGVPNRKFFDKEGNLLRGGCISVAQAVTTTARIAKMQQEFDLLPPWHPNSN